MPSIIYPFDTLDPDTGDRGKSGAGFVINMNPVAGTLVPGPSMRPIRPYMDENEDPIQEQITEIHSHDSFILTSSFDDNKLYIGDLYGVAQDPFEYNVTPSSGWSTSNIGPTRWEYSFCSFGDRVFAAAPNNKICFIDINDFRADNTTKFDFSSPSSGAYNPEAEHLATHGGHLVAAGITFEATWNGLSGYNDQMVWWSGFDNPESFGSYAFTPNILGSDYKFLYDTPGKITGMVSTGDHLFVFKENYIYLAEGPPFRFNLLASNIGTRCTNSIMYHRSWVYFMSINGPARINVSGEYQILSDGKTKVTLNLDKTTRDLELGTGLGAVSFNAIMMFPFSPNGFSQSYTYAHRRVFTAVSEQYNIIYFAYPSYFSVYPEAPKSFYLSHMVVMSYDIITGSIGYSIPWASDQVGVPLVPWGEDEIETTKGPDFTRGTRNFFAMTTLGYKPAKGKAKDVIVIGTSMYEYIGTGHFLMTEEQYDMGYYYLDPTVFYGKNWSAYTRSCVGTKIIRPDASKTRINRVRPIMRFGYNSSHYHPVCQVATFSDTSIGGVEIYSHDPFVEFGPYVDSPLELIDTDESTNIAADGSIILSDTVYGDEHIVVFSFHTESPNGPVEKAQFVTTTGIVGLEIFYDVQGKVSR